MTALRAWLAGAALTLLAACVGVPAAPDTEWHDRQPEQASGSTAKIAVAARNFMVSTANPHATRAGHRILKAGGSAVDAAIAVQMVLTLVEPQSSGIGGGAFLLHFDGQAMTAFDGRETAPAAVDEHLFEKPDGQPMAFFDAVVGGRAVGVPGVLRMLELAHRRHGKLPWAALFAPAIELAESGFEVSPRLAQLLASEPQLALDPESEAYFFDEHGLAWQAGHPLKNPALARTLRLIAAGGADAFYTGELARAIVSKIGQHPRRPGVLALRDMSGYRAVVRTPVCTDYKAWRVCGMPPPSSGGIAVAQMLGILAHRNLPKLAPDAAGLNVEGVHLFAEAGRLAYADRARYVADTDFVPLPGGSVDALIDKDYLAARAGLIGERSMGTAAAGAPLGIKLARGYDRSPELAATSHLSIVDAQGQVVSMTTSIENGFGSRLMVQGFLLNNQLTDFSFVAADADGPVANRVQPGKRPRSAMAPTIVLERRTGHVALVVGSPGGPAIINYVAKVLVGMMDWGLPVQEAVDLPNFGSRNGPTELERGRFSPEQIVGLRVRGHVLRIANQTSGLHAISRIEIHGEPWWMGGADSRREGSVEGE
ncbi:MAG: gamma-glutamyltransferase [Herminiimonas sp.]|nr:gamma-glutamyltransferase [Herminiimonas sp.]